MEPLLPDGSFAFFRKTKKKVRTGDILLVNHPGLGRIVKKTASVSGNTVSLAGISPLSTSTEKLGKIHFRHIAGRYFFGIFPPGKKRSP